MAKKSIDIRIRVDAAKFDRLVELMPDYEKGGGEKSTVIYWSIDVAIAALMHQNTLSQSYRSNRDYLRRE